MLQTLTIFMHKFYLINTIDRACWKIVGTLKPIGTPWSWKERLHDTIQTTAVVVEAPLRNSGHKLCKRPVVQKTITLNDNDRAVKELLRKCLVNLVPVSLLKEFFA